MPNIEVSNTSALKWPDADCNGLILLIRPITIYHEKQQRGQQRRRGERGELLRSDGRKVCQKTILSN